jgi:hypothetical protein
MPLIQTLIGRIMLQRRLDEVSLAISALKLGDGSGHASGGAIATSNLSTYQGGNPAGFESMTLTGYLGWLSLFAPGTCTTIISNTADLLLAWQLASPTTVPIWMNNNINTSGLWGKPRLVNMGIAGDIAYVKVPIADVLENHIIGIDKRYALMGYREVGSDLTETNKVINGQFDEVVMSNTVGFQTLFADARKDLVGSA